MEIGIQFGNSSRPDHTTRIGAIAMTGTACDAITYGMRPRSASFDRTKRTPRPNPVTAPITNPIAAERHVHNAA